jgi:hypothetical protein
MSIRRGTAVSVMIGQSALSKDLFRFVVREIALRFEPVVDVTTILAAAFLISLVSTPRDRITGSGTVSRRCAIPVLDIVRNALDR